MGVPAPVIKNRIGEAFRNNLNCHFTLIGHFGHNLTTVAGIEGGVTQRNYNAITCWIISASLASAGIEHEEQQITPAKPPSGRPFPAAPSTTTQGRKTTASSLNSSSLRRAFTLMRVHLEGEDDLIDVKTLAAGHCY